MSMKSSSLSEDMNASIFYYFKASSIFYYFRQFLGLFYLCLLQKKTNDISIYAIISVELNGIILIGCLC